MENKFLGRENRIYINNEIWVLVGNHYWGGDDREAAKKNRLACNLSIKLIAGLSY